MIISIKCFFGWHDWYYPKMKGKDMDFPKRICRHCKRVEEENYDMLYGERYWQRLK